MVQSRRDVVPELNRMRRLAHLISIIFNPVFVSTIVFPILIVTADGVMTQERTVFLAIVILFTSIVPLAHVAFLMRRGKVDSFDVDVRLKRLGPLAVGVAGYIAAFAGLSLLQAPAIVRGLMFCYAVNTLLVLLITRRWKVSIHATGISGPLVALSYHFGAATVPLYLLIPIIGGARIVLRKHSVAQVVAGVAIGLALTAFQLHYLFL